MFCDKTDTFGRRFLLRSELGFGKEMWKMVYKLTPSLHDNIWGGNRLRKYGKKSDADRIAESWELSFVFGNEAKIEDGRSLSEAFSREDWGDNCRGFEFFPTLTKFIDARDKLSVQVHPSDEYALSNEGQYGKTEMWYVVDAEPGAGLYMGLSREVSKEEFASRVKDGTVEQILSFREVKPADVFFIPAGTVHAIGAGVLIYEIQQNSTLTYRLYDYMRVDKDGKLRELHVDKALDVCDLSVYRPTRFGEDEIIGKCKYFEVERMEVSGKAYVGVTKDSYVALSVVSGSGSCDGTPATAGDSFFAPASNGEISLEGNMTVLVVRTPKQQ